MPGLPLAGTTDEVRRLEEALAETWHELEKARGQVARRDDLSGALWQAWCQVQEMLECDTLEEVWAIARNILPQEGRVKDKIYPPPLSRGEIEALYFHYIKNGIPETQTAAAALAKKLKDYLEATDPAIERARDEKFVIAAESAYGDGLDREAMHSMIDRLG